MRREDLVTALESASDPGEALRTLDAVAAEGGDGVALGELYDDVADRFADADEYASAAAAQRKAIEHGYTGIPDGREMLAWYLLRAEEDDEAGAVWNELLTERPDDPDLALTAGVAYRDANRPQRAAELLKRSIELMLAGSVDGNALREAVSERIAALQQLDRQAEQIDDHAVEALARLERQADGGAIAVPWYPADAYALALERFPQFARDWDGHHHASYSHELDVRVREVTAVHGHAPRIVPIDVDAYAAFAGRVGLDPDWSETRARYADQHQDDAIAWPPGRNDACWCGVDAKYKRHCGA